MDSVHAGVRLSSKVVLRLCVSIAARIERINPDDKICSDSQNALSNSIGGFETRGCQLHKQRNRCVLFVGCELAGREDVPLDLSDQFYS